MSGNESSPTEATEVVGLATASGKGDTLAPGAQIGPYRIVSLLGEGGMGSVYLAEQQSPVFRQVALKLIREQMSSPMARVWFEVERQALAQMQHPAIAQVYDAGATDNGTLFLAMELVDGVPITRFCREHGLDRAARLTLFRRVCLGVQHAHQKGVIHRDLKPDNVLVREVDGVPQPKIIDFGIAVGDAAAADPQAHERAGTAAYMSPEQASRTRRDIDTRSDVYSLGVMLFEVLTDGDAAETTGASFHSGADLRTTLLRVDDADGAAPASVPDPLLAAAADLPRELRAVLRKALASERADRYDSAAALAEDLQRYLERRPLAALPPTRAYTARKFVARHRLGLSAAALVVAALVAGIVLALAAERRAEIQASRAEQTSRFITGILSGVDPDEARGMDTALLRKLLDRAAERVDTELADQPEVSVDIEIAIAGSYFSIDDYKTATRHAERAMKALAASRVGDLERGHELIRAARIINLTGDPKRAHAIGKRALALAAGAPSDDTRRLDIDEQMAWFEANVGHLEAGLARMQSAYERRLAAVDPDEERIADDRRAIGTMASDMGDYARAEEVQRALLDSNRVHFGDDNTNTIIAAGELAITLLREKRFADGERMLREWLPHANRIYGAGSAFVMNMRSNLGGAIRQQGRNEEARPYYQAALEFNRRQYGANSRETLSSEANLAYLLRDTGDLAAAEQYARSAIAVMDGVLGNDNAYRGVFPDLLGTILLKQKRYAEAGKEFERAWKLFSAGSGYGPQHPLAQDVARHFVDLYTAWDKPDEAARWRAKLVEKAGHDGG